VKVGLCIIVKDEERTIAGCIDSVIEICEDIVVVDTGSTDGTANLLRQRYGITPISRPLDHERSWSLYPARNLSFAQTRAGWLLCLDADERLSPAGVERIASLPDELAVDGYFCAWRTHQDNAVIEDYKLSLFRKGLQSVGFVHENLQPSVRDSGGQIEWLDGVVIEHYPESVKDGEKAAFYHARLEYAIAQEPTWYRYHWFLGYKLWREGREEAASGYLQVAAASDSRRFPVECLNSRMLLAAIHARRGERPALREHLAQARRFLTEVADDFEVRVNFRLGPWLEHAAELEAGDRLREIVPYAFPY
jgi:glycosyltransferase involved in cell wall biosynthesis